MILAQKVSKSKCDSPLTKADIVKSFHVVVEKYSCDSSKVFAISPEVNISPKISISAQPLKMALHRNPAVHGTRMVIFLHDSKKAPF